MSWIDTFFDDFYTKTYTHLDKEITVKQVDFIIDILKIEKKHKILDIPCGFGRHSLELTKRGYDVTGMEYHQTQIDRAKKLMKEEGVEFPIIQADMRNIPHEGKYDRLYNYFTSFGYFIDEENEETVRQFNKALKPGGLLLLESMNRDWIIKNMDPGRIHHNDDGSIFLEESEFDPLTSRMHGTHTLVKPGAKIEKRELNLRTYSAHELINLFSANGFEIERVCNHEGKDFTTWSKRIVMVIRKK